MLYTSGTSGNPKGVPLTYRNVGVNGRDWLVCNAPLIEEGDRDLLWLPMSHVFGKVLLSVQLEIGFPTAVDGRVERIVDNLGVVRPTFMGAAPRIFEKAHGKIVTMVEADGGLKKQLFERAFAVGTEIRVPHGLPVVPADRQPWLRLLTRGAELATPEEIEANPRSAPVRLRAAERVGVAA